MKLLQLLKEIKVNYPIPTNIVIQFIKDEVEKGNIKLGESEDWYDSRVWEWNMSNVPVPISKYFNQGTPDIIINYMNYRFHFYVNTWDDDIDFEGNYGILYMEMNPI
jgi:hypothetical protein